MACTTVHFHIKSKTRTAIVEVMHSDNCNTLGTLIMHHSKKLLFQCNSMLLYEAIENEKAKVCFVFHNAHSVLYFPLDSIAPEKSSP